MAKRFPAKCPLLRDADLGEGEMRPGASTVGNGTHTPTHESPTPAQGNMGADLNNNGTEEGQVNDSGTTHSAWSTSFPTGLPPNAPFEPNLPATASNLGCG